MKNKNPQPDKKNLVEIYRGGEHVLYCDGVKHWAYFYGKYHLDGSCTCSKEAK